MTRRVSSAAISERRAGLIAGATEVFASDLPDPAGPGEGIWHVQDLGSLRTRPSAISWRRRPPARSRCGWSTCAPWRAGPTILKSVAAARVTSRLVNAEEFHAFSPAQGPVHLQRYVAGADVRVHVVGGRVRADLATPLADTGRFSATTPVSTSRHELPAPLAARVVKATAAFGLTLAGWDSRLAQDGTYWCLEANPMPGYDGQDYRLGGAIITSLLDTLVAHRAAVALKRREQGRRTLLSPRKLERWRIARRVSSRTGSSN